MKKRGVGKKGKSLLRETDLAAPVEKWLRGQGYEVSHEVKDCDLVARRGDDLVIVELKTGMSLALVIQAVRRKELCESVYVAVPLRSAAASLPNQAGVKALLRRLETGLIVVRFLKKGTRLEVLLHPAPFSERKRPKKRIAILREIDSRWAELDMGGSPASAGRMTAYRQAALVAAWHLKQEGPASPARLRELGTGPKTQSILGANLFGWFDHPERGLYTLSEAGAAALEQHRDALKAMGLGGKRRKKQDGLTGC